MNGKWTGWLVAAGMVALGVIAYLASRARGDIDTARAGADMLEAWHTQDVAARRRRVDNLMSDFRTNESKIKKLYADINDKRSRLDEAYKAKELPASEIAERLRRIGL